MVNRLVVALGNCGEKYKNTRHNAAWLMLDDIYPDLEWQKFSSISLIAKKDNAIFLKPQNFMNRSGVAVREVWNYFFKNIEISPETLCVIHDDVVFDLTDIRFQENRSDAGHNGIKSVSEQMGQNYSRVRIGIKNQEDFELESYVLGTFSEEEKTNLLIETPKIKTYLEKWIQNN